MKVILITPATRRDFDEEIIPVETETWSEVLDAVESIIEDHFMDYDWEGQVNITIKFQEMTEKQFAEYLPED